MFNYLKTFVLKNDQCNHRVRNTLNRDTTHVLLGNWIIPYKVAVEMNLTSGAASNSYSPLTYWDVLKDTLVNAGCFCTGAEEYD